VSVNGERLELRDWLRVASVGLRARPLRAALSALGIAIGTAAIVGVLGLSASSQAGLIAEINRLGTNLLTVEAGQSLTGGPAQLPREAPARITLLDDVQQVAHTALIKNTYVYRSSIVPVAETGGLQVRATDLNLLPVLDTGLARGDWLNTGTARLPVAVLGSIAAQQLGIDRVYPNERIWLGGQWFNVAGILNPSPLEPDIDVSALVGYPAAQTYLGYVSIVHGATKTGPPSTIYVRAATGHEAAVQGLLAQTADPEAPYEAAVSQPSDVLTARAAAAGAFNSLFLGLGAVALMVGAVGGRQHHDHLRPRAPLRDRPPPRTRRDEEPDTNTIPRRVDPARRHRRHRRRARGRHSNRRLCRHKELGRHHSRPGVDERHRRGDPDRRGRRPTARHPGIPDAAHRGLANRVALRSNPACGSPPRSTCGALGLVPPPEWSP
jgi:putative ABC transport system permease protein